MTALLALWRLRNVLLVGAFIAVSGISIALWSRWQGERADRIEAETELAAALRGQAIADEVRRENAARAEQIGRALAEAWKDDPDAAASPVDPGLLRAVECVRRPASCNGPR